MPNTKTAEKNLWNSMRTAIKSFGTNLHYTRIENSVSDGFPDTEFSLLLDGTNYNCTIELKTAARPVHFETKVPAHIRLGQVRWLLKRWRVGGSSWMLIQVGSGKDLARYLIPGSLVKVAEQGVSETWYRDHSRCDPNDPLDVIVQKACTARSLDW